MLRGPSEKRSSKKHGGHWFGYGTWLLNIYTWAIAILIKGYTGGSDADIDPRVAMQLVELNLPTIGGFKLLIRREVAPLQD